MDKATYALLESYMLSCMHDSAHDKEHVYRVLYTALAIAKKETDVDYDILIGACLLHDIGRQEQLEDPALCHALVGGDKAYVFLKDHGFPEEYAARVRQCIRTHRFRKNDPPQSLEAKILFDADKLDVAGAMGIARTLVYKGAVSDPLYRLNPHGQVSDGTGDTQPSFFQEYKFKLENLYSRFYTQAGARMAAQRRPAAVAFYESLLEEVRSAYENGTQALEETLQR